MQYIAMKTKYLGFAIPAMLLFAWQWRSSSSNSSSSSRGDGEYNKPTIRRTQQYDFDRAASNSSEAGDLFESNVLSTSGLSIRSKGEFKLDRITPFWNIGKNDQPNTNQNAEYMYSTLPMRKWLPVPSPMWRLEHRDAVVLIFDRPPPMEYFSFTTNCFHTKRRGFVFASLGDTLNIMSPEMMTNHQVFAHVVATQKSKKTVDMIENILVTSGIPKEAIHVAAIPDTLEDDDSMALYQVVMRLFKFHNETRGNDFLKSRQPVYYVDGPRLARRGKKLPEPKYSDRYSLDSVDEPALYGADLNYYRESLVDNLNQTLGGLTSVQSVDFGAVEFLVGLECIKNIGSECLGDCPDAVYSGAGISLDRNDITFMTIPKDDEFHLITAVDHKMVNSSIFSSVQMTSASEQFLDKRGMAGIVSGTPYNIMTNQKYYDDAGSNAEESRFFSWIFSQNPDHCKMTSQLVNGCTVIDEEEMEPDRPYISYAERVYLNPATGKGPDYRTLLPAKLHHLRVVKSEEAFSRDEIMNLDEVEFLATTGSWEEGAHSMSFQY